MPGLSAMTLANMATGATGRPLWPSDITGLQLWLMADQIQGIASGASLSLWTDSSGSASHATQASANAQPIFLVNQRNGLSAVSFGGSSQSQQIASLVSTHDGITFAVAWLSGLTVNSSQRLIGTASALRINAPGGPQSFLMTRAAGSITFVGPPINTWQTAIAFCDGASSNATLSYSSGIGASLVTTNNSLTTSGLTQNQVNIGGVSPSALTGSFLVGEILMYNRNLTESERSSLDSYLRTKWAI